jgi:hypothetical protein
LEIRQGAQAATIAFGVLLMLGHQAAADQVIPDDLIVQGSVCTGFDCVNNEDFGFTTLRLKENNTRIDFVDTSATAGFAGRDWRLEANSSGSGGANYFAIKDMGDASTGAEGGVAIFSVTAGAPANSLFVDSGGRAGFGTSTPVLKLHARTSDTPGLRFEQDGSGGFTPQTWDVAGNEANFFVRDVTGGSLLPLRIRPGAPTSSVDISASGKVGIGTGSPQDTLHVLSSGDTGLRIESTQAPALQKWSFLLTGANGIMSLRDQNAGTNPLRVRPGAPSNSLEIRPNGIIALAGYPNCGTLSTNASGALVCVPSAPAAPFASAASSQASVGGVVRTSTSSSIGGGSGSSASGAKSSDASRTAANGEQVGCSAGDLAGNWSLIGTNVERFGDSSVLWCDVTFAPADERSFRYSVSGQCRNHDANEAAQPYELSARGTVTANAACRLSGGIKLRRGRTTLTSATIVEGRVESIGVNKTRAVGVSRWSRGRTNTMQTFVMQR